MRFAPFCRHSEIFARKAKNLKPDFAVKLYDFLLDSAKNSINFAPRIKCESATLSLRVLAIARRSNPNHANLKDKANQNPKIESINKIHKINAFFRRFVLESVKCNLFP